MKKASGCDVMGRLLAEIPPELALKVALFSPNAARRLCAREHGLFGASAARMSKDVAGRLSPWLGLSAEGRIPSHPWWDAVALPRGGALRLLVQLAQRLWLLASSQLRGICASVCLETEAPETLVMRVTVCGGSPGSTVYLPFLGPHVYLRHETFWSTPVQDMLGIEGSAYVSASDAGRKADCEVLEARCSAELPALLDAPCTVSVLAPTDAEASSLPSFSVAGLSAGAADEELRGVKVLRVRGLVLRREESPA